MLAPCVFVGHHLHAVEVKVTGMLAGRLHLALQEILQHLLLLVQQWIALVIVRLSFR